MNKADRKGQKMSIEEMTVEELLQKLSDLRSRWKSIAKHAIFADEDFAAEISSGIVLSISGIMDAVESIHNASSLLPAQTAAVWGAAMGIDFYGSAHINAIVNRKIKELSSRKGDDKNETGIQYD